MSLYHRYPLTSSKTCVRLLKYLTDLSFEILVSELDHCPPFKALSYEWGDGPARQVTVNGYCVTVRPNLHELLTKSLCKDGYIWCDAICINQSSDTERSHQVQLMCQIYSSAETTIVWLGDGGFASGDKLKTYEMLAALTRRSYWARMWIVQEIIVSNQIIVQCGDETWPWDKLAEACRFPADQNVRWAADLWAIPENADTDFIKRRALLGREIHYSLLNSLAQCRRQWPQNMEALHLLVERYEKSDCRDDRDNVIALLGIAKEVRSRIDFEVNYSLDKEDTFYQLLRWAESGAVALRHRMRFAYAIAKGLKLEKLRQQPMQLTIPMQIWGIDDTKASPNDIPLSFIKTSLAVKVTFLGSLDTGVLFACQNSMVTRVGAYGAESRITAYVDMMPATVNGFDEVIIKSSGGRVSIQLSNSSQLQMLIEHCFEKTFDIVPKKSLIAQHRGGSGSLPKRPEDQTTIRERLLRKLTSLSNSDCVDTYPYWDEGRTKYSQSVEADFDALRGDADLLARSHDPELPPSSPIVFATGRRPDFSIPARSSTRQDCFRRTCCAREKICRHKKLFGVRTKSGWSNKNFVF